MGPKTISDKLQYILSEMLPLGTKGNIQVSSMAVMYASIGGVLG